MKIRKGDTVIVTSGRDRGSKGKVEHVFPKAHAVLVPGLNVVKRHTKKRNEKHPGGIIDIPHPLGLGKIALICPSCGKPTRVGTIVARSEKVRVCKKCGKKI